MAQAAIKGLGINELERASALSLDSNISAASSVYPSQDPKSVKTSQGLQYQPSLVMKSRRVQDVESRGPFVSSSKQARA